jgi:hypothetical protein
MGELNSPWGLAIAPSGFGSLAGDLLVGNFGDGRINIFSADPNAPAFLSQLLDKTGNPLTIDGLWGLIPGGGGGAGDPHDIYFTAGPDDESGGVLGPWGHGRDRVPRPGGPRARILAIPCPAERRDRDLYAGDRDSRSARPDWCAGPRCHGE